LLGGLHLLLMRRAFLLFIIASVAAGLAVVGALASAAAAAPADEMTLRVDRFFDAAYGRFRITFSGTIPNRTANEYVTVMAQRCGHQSATAVAGGLTREDGSWEDTWLGFSYGGTATYRARWRGNLSEPVTVRGQLQLSVSKRPGGRYSVGFAADSNLGGRFVELQRLAAGRWTRVRRARLEPGGGSGTSFRASFTVRRKGVTLRIALPRKSAAPCYEPAVTQTFVS
jgi:hypothetical protein